MNISEFKELNIVKITGKRKGGAIAILAGVHGNEKTGIMVLDHLGNHSAIESGTVYLVYVNKKAIELNKRYVDINLNRSIIKGLKKDGYEKEVAQELMTLLDHCDAVLDLHAYSQKTGKAPCFAICEPNSFEILNTMDLPFSISSLHKFAQGSTDQYMFFSNKIGICLELGSLERPNEYLQKGIDYANKFINFFQNGKDIINTKNNIIHLEPFCFYKKQNEDFNFIKNLKNFDILKKGEIFATENKKNIIAKQNCWIIFPNKNNPIGENVFILTKNKEDV